MDSHSKNVLLIGILHIVGYILFSLEPLMRATTILNSSEDDEESSVGSEPIFHLAVVGFYTLMLIFSGLMIHGVRKQNHLLIAPFFISSVLILATMIILFCMHLMAEYQGEPFYIFQDSLYTLGVQIIVLYPIYTLFVKLRLKSLKEKSLIEATFECGKKPLEVLA